MKKNKLTLEIFKQLGILITGAFAFISALAWNDAFQTFFTTIFETSHELSALFSYAIIISIVAVIVTIWIGKIINKTIICKY